MTHGWALITGAAHGIGRACAVRLAADGYALLLADLDSRAVDHLGDELRKQGTSCVTRVTDVASGASVAALADVIRDACGRVDVLVNSAGIRTIGSIMKTGLDEWDRTQAVNVRGTFACIQLVVPFMRDQGGGRIINIGSISGIRGLGNRSAYCASKAAVHGLTRQAALELSPLNIQVNAVAPGYTQDTPFTEVYEGDDVVASALAKSLPPGGRATRPEEVAHAVSFLASPLARPITGSVLVLDAGVTQSVLIDGWPWATDPEMLPPG